MKPSPYRRFRREELSLTDRLALDRTSLALERTLLSYLRTALGMVAMGGTFLLFLANAWTDGAGYALIALGGGTGVTGTVQFLRMKRRLGNLVTTTDDGREPVGTPDRTP